MSVRSGVIGMERVARRTLVDILGKEKSVIVVRSPSEDIQHKTGVVHLGNPGIPLHLLLSKILAHLPGKVIEAVKGAGMEQSISRLPEHSGHLVVVIGHKLGLRRLLRQGKQPMDIFHCLKSFLQKEEQSSY